MGLHVSEEKNQGLSFLFPPSHSVFPSGRVKGELEGGLENKQLLSNLMMKMMKIKDLASIFTPDHIIVGFIKRSRNDSS